MRMLVVAALLLAGCAEESYDPVTGERLLWRDTWYLHDDVCGGSRDTSMSGQDLPGDDECLAGPDLGGPKGRYHADRGSFGFPEGANALARVHVGAAHPGWIRVDVRLLADGVEVGAGSTGGVVPVGGAGPTFVPVDVRFPVLPIHEGQRLVLEVVYGPGLAVSALGTEGDHASFLEVTEFLADRS
jgi:hypothetical protein